MCGTCGCFQKMHGGVSAPSFGAFPWFIPGSPGESGLVSRGSQGLRSPLESRRGSLGPPLFGLLQQVAEDLVKGILLEAQVNQHLHRGPRQLQPRLRLSPSPLLHGRGWFGLQQRANAGRDAGPRGPEVLVGVLAQVQHLKLPPPAGPCRVRSSPRD